MEKELEPNHLPSQKVEKGEPAERSVPLSLRERSIDKMGKLSWIAVLNQLLLGLGLLILAIWLSIQFINGWIVVIAAVLFFTGNYYGWYISKDTDIHLSDSGAAIFSYAGLWKKFWPMIVLLFLLRMTFVYLDRNGIVNMAPFMRTLTFFIAGVFAARGGTLLILIFHLKKKNAREKEKQAALKRN